MENCLTVIPECQQLNPRLVVGYSKVCMFIGLSEKEKEERYEQSLMTEDRLGEGWPGKVPSSGEEEEDNGLVCLKTAMHLL